MTTCVTSVNQNTDPDPLFSNVFFFCKIVRLLFQQVRQAL